MIQVGQLSNGIRIITELVPQANLVSVYCSVEVGSQHDPIQYSGLSHLLEHTLFLGTKSYSTDEINRFSRQIGTEINAGTDREATSVTTDILPEDLPQTLSFISEMLTECVFPPQQIENEKKIVLDEIDNVGEDVDATSYNLIYQAAYPNQSVQYPIGGYAATVETITPDILKQHYRLYAQPEKIIIGLSGAIDHRKSLLLCQQLFGNIRPSGITKELPELTYIGTDKRIPAFTARNHIHLAFNGVPLKSPKHHVTGSLLAIILENALFDKLRHDQGLLYDIQVENDAFKNGSLFTVSTNCKPKMTKNILYGCAAVIGKINHLITPETLKIAQKSLKIESGEQRHSLAENAHQNVFNLRYFNRIVSAEEYIKIIDAVQPNDLQLAAEQIFSSRPSFAAMGMPNTIPAYRHIVKWLQDNRAPQKICRAAKPFYPCLAQSREKE